MEDASFQDAHVGFLQNRKGEKQLSGVHVRAPRLSCVLLTAEVFPRDADNFTELLII